MLVNRESVGLLDDSWAVLGVYFLLGPFEDGPDLYRAYVGEVGKRTLLLRVKEPYSKLWSVAAFSQLRPQTARSSREF